MQQSQPSAKRDALRLTLAASLLVLTQVATAADEINITPAQRQITTKKLGIITLRFEVENRSGEAQQLQESLTLPTGWELITNTAPFYLASGARDVRLIHVVVPNGTPSGTYLIGYQISAQDNGGITSSQTVAIQVEEQAGIKLAAISPPSSLLSGESYDAGFLLENTGNHAVTYTLSADDDEGYITGISPRSIKLEAGESGEITVSGKIPANLAESSTYRINLSAKGGGKSTEESVTIPLISRTPKGIGKYQKLPGKLTTRYTNQKHINADGSETDTSQAQVEYTARGAIDQEGKHNLEIQLRNGRDRNDSDINTKQQADYQINYSNDELEIKTGNQNFHTSNLSGNALSGIGVETVYKPKNKKQRKPLEVRAFAGQSRPHDLIKEKVSGAAVQYQVDEIEAGASVIRHQKAQTDTEPSKDETITAVNAAWQGENTGIRTEVAKDSDAQAWSVDVNGQWHEVSANASYVSADTQFDGSNTDTKQVYANARYQIDDNTNIEANTRHTRNNLAQDQTKEIRQDKESQIKVSHSFGEERQIEVSLGHKQRTEKDLRPVATTDREIAATTLEYRHQFETFNVRAEVAHGLRKDRRKKSRHGNKQEFVFNWKPSKAIDINSNYSISNDLDSEGKATTAGINAAYKINRRNTLTGYLQRNKNDSENSHADSFEVKYSHDMKSLGTIDLSARRVNNLASDGKISHDNIMQVEYSVPLDMPIRKRTNIGSVRGKVHFAHDQRPASDVVLQMGGQYAVTDQNGEFNYPEVLAKEYPIQLDASRANTQGYMLSHNGEEATVNITPKKIAEPVLELYPASRITGKLQTYVPDSASALNITDSTDNLRADKGLSRVLIELRPTGEIGNRITHKRTTLYDGSFSFVGIPPGQWQLVVVDNDKVPANYHLEQTQFAVDLSSGGTKDILIRALPIAQTIKKNGPDNGFNVVG